MCVIDVEIFSVTLRDTVALSFSDTSHTLIVCLALILVLFIATSFCGYVIYLFGMMRSSRSIHKELVQSVLSATWRSVHKYTLILAADSL